MKKAITAILLTAVCTASASAEEIAQKAAALSKVAPDKKLTMMVVPAAGNYISNKMIVVRLKAGTDSQSSLQISTILQQPSPVQLAITGENDAVAEATLEQALSSLKGKLLRPHEVAFIGDREYEEVLTSKAAEAGINLVSTEPGRMTGVCDGANVQGRNPYPAVERQSRAASCAACHPPLRSPYAPLPPPLASG